MLMNNRNENCDSCIAQILNVILVLQQNACPDGCLDSCDRPVLGGGASCLVCNTRPIQLYLCGSNSTPLSMPVDKDPVEGGEVSSVFRVEKIDGCCATCRVLASNPDTTSLNPYIGTNSFFTVDINCCCAMRCLSDTYVECV